MLLNTNLSIKILIEIVRRGLFEATATEELVGEIQTAVVEKMLSEGDDVTDLFRAYMLFSNFKK